MQKTYTKYIYKYNFELDRYKHFNSAKIQRIAFTAMFITHKTD